jgi:hypothetical protein
MIAAFLVLVGEMVFYHVRHKYYIEIEKNIMAILSISWGNMI